MVEDVATGQAIGTLVSLVGGAGVSGVIIAVIGYMTAARGGRKGDAEHAGMGITALLADSGSITKLALALETMTLEMRKGVVFLQMAQPEFKGQFETMIDEVRKLRRAVEDKP
jgi:hypothetical protein